MTGLATRRVERGTGGFFWFVFFAVKENELIFSSLFKENL